MPDQGAIIVSILQMIRERRVTLKELASAHCLTQDRLENRMAWMERHGYLLRERVCDPRPRDHACRCCCLPCDGRGPAGRAFRLTEKGRRIAEAGGKIPRS